MATLRWIGGASPVAQVNSWELANTWEADDVVRFIVGSKVVDVTVGSTTITTILDNLVAAWNALDETTYPEFAELTASEDGATKFILTADTAGVPFTVSLTPLESNLAGSGAQTIEGGTTATTGTAVTASAGPNDWSTAKNWDTGAIPVNGDTVYFSNSSVDCLYGLAQSGVTVTNLHLEQSFTGRLGLKEHNGTYPEYRATYLALSVTNLKIGYGPGTGSPLIRLNVGSNACTFDMLDSGSSEETGVEAVLWKGTHTDNIVNVTKGSLGVAVRPGETSTIATLRIGFRSNEAGDSNVRCGSGVTLTTINQAGGQLEISSNVTTLTKTGGDVVVNGTATVTTYNIDGGTVFHRSSGTITTANIGEGGVLDLSQDMRARTITNCTITKGAVINDPVKTATFTNPITLTRAGLKDVDLELGTSITIQRA